MSSAPPATWFEDSPNGVLAARRAGLYCVAVPNPPTSRDDLPSWQTCYRSYRRWETAGLMSQVYYLLYQDLCERGGIDLAQVDQVPETNGQLIIQRFFPP